jgi:hypothetical protein
MQELMLMDIKSELLSELENNIPLYALIRKMVFGNPFLKIRIAALRCRISDRWPLPITMAV